MSARHARRRVLRSCTAIGVPLVLLHVVLWNLRPPASLFTTFPRVARAAELASADLFWFHDCANAADDAKQSAVDFLSLYGYTITAFSIGPENTVTLTAFEGSPSHSVTVREQARVSNVTVRGVPLTVVDESCPETGGSFPN